MIDSAVKSIFALLLKEVTVPKQALHGFVFRLVFSIVLIANEFIEKIVVYAPKKSNGHITQQDICFYSNVLIATIISDSVVYDKKRKVA